MDKKILVITGHYGSGKTNLSINMAFAYRRQGESVTVVDMDIENPYFCSGEYGALLKGQGINLVASLYAGSNLEAPALASLDEAIALSRRVIIDVGGDDAGAVVLGRYRQKIAQAGGCEMLYVVNGCRFLTQTPVQSVALLRRIEQAAQMKVTGIVNNTNLGKETTLELLEQGMAFGEETARLAGLPLLFTAADKRLLGMKKRTGKIFPVEVIVRKPWEPALQMACDRKEA